MRFTFSKFIYLQKSLTNYKYLYQTTILHFKRGKLTKISKFLHFNKFLIRFTKLFKKHFLVGVVTIKTKFCSFFNYLYNLKKFRTSF